jgi:hypothetical protein
MPKSDLLPSLLFKINQNQLVLEAAIMELTVVRAAGIGRGLGVMYDVHLKRSEKRRVHQHDACDVDGTSVSPRL